MSLSTCTIYYPGLLGPDVPLDELDESSWPSANLLANLNTFYNYGKITAVDLNNYRRSPEARMLKLLGVSHGQDDGIPAAYFRARYFQHSNDYLWCLDPVHIQIDLDEAVLVSNDALDIEESEARKLIEDLNHHFEQDDIHIRYCSPQNWLLKTRLDISTSPISDVLYGNINNYQPVGNDKVRWRKLINEIQMFLYNHPVNIERQAQGKLPVNSLWLWGEGESGLVQTSIQLACGDQELLAHVASVINVAHQPLPDQFNPEAFANSASLIILTEQLQSIYTKDVFGWFGLLQKFDKDILEPLISLLRRGSLEQLLLHGDTIEILLTKKHLHRGFFSSLKINKNFRQNITQLRNQYGC